MARPRFPRLKDGQQLEPQHINMIYAELERWNKTIGAGGIVFENRVSGPVISGGGSGMIAGEGERLAKLPSGGIASGATGTVTFYEDETTLSTETASARNPWATAAPSLRKCVVGSLVGIDGWVVKYWDCA